MDTRRAVPLTDPAHDMLENLRAGAAVPDKKGLVGEIEPGARFPFRPSARAKDEVHVTLRTKSPCSSAMK
jgi:hypothetical protein